MEQNLEKKYHCLNCFADQLIFKNGRKKYTKDYQYTYRGFKPIPNTNVGIWMPKAYNVSGWINEIMDKQGIILEYKKDKNGKKEKIEVENEKYNYRYVFIRKNNIYNEEVFEFAGLYYLDKNRSNDNQRLWIKYNENDINLNAKELIKKIAI